MTVLELKAILDDAIEKGCGDMLVEAIVAKEATTEKTDCAYGVISDCFVVEATVNRYPNAE